jgi:UPF0271 protein
MPSIDLNADCGESFGAWRMGDDATLMPLLSSVNLACGGHAGDPATLRASIRLAQQSGLAIGAHPSYPDLLGFGRRPMTMPTAELLAHVFAQIGGLAALCTVEGVRLSHVKAHGALYHTLSSDVALADAFVQALARFDAGLAIIGPPFGALAESASRHGLHYLREGFVERGYNEYGHLIARGQAGAELHNVEEICAQALALARGDQLSCAGVKLRLRVDTLCLHGDRENAVGIARAVRAALLQAGIEIMRP